MKVLYGYKGISKKLKSPIIAIGIFDGIHIGHKRVIKSILSLRSPGRSKAILTFDPHPETVLGNRKKPPRIMSLDHKLHILGKMGVDAAIVIRFTDYIAMMSPEEFIKKVLLVIGAKTVYVGSNFHFGRGKSGDTESFKRIGKEYGIEVKVINPVRKRGKTVSSTWLRKLITKGELDKAEELLRRPVSVFGTVVGGERRGREIGVPTANIDPHHEVIPPPGVYAVKVDYEGKFVDGVLNIGFKPTFFGNKLKKRKEPHIEVHLINFKGDLYNKALEIFFVKRLRRERKFSQDEKLKKQIEIDKNKAYKYLESKRILTKIKRYKYL